MQIDRRTFVGTGMAGALSINFEHSGTLPMAPGVSVGHWTCRERPTGCTVTLFDGQGAVAGVDVRGSAPGTRETDLLHPLNTVERVNAIVLSGGSAFGLDTASGVMRFLEERKLGFAMGTLVVPIVPAAILFDLALGDGRVRPNADAGYQACLSATRGPVAEGNVGAGAGATVGKLFGSRYAMKGGLGCATLAIPGTDVLVSAMAAVNAVGDILDHRTGTILAGARAETGGGLRGTVASLLSTRPQGRKGENSTIGLVTTNAKLSKVQANKMAQMAHDGLARSINPVHTAYDGDTIFAAATGLSQQTVDFVALGSIAAECMAFAIERAVVQATSIAGYPAHRDLPG